eukprot:jgi/Hompol1/617/HPOL_005363-RA
MASTLAATTAAASTSAATAAATATATAAATLQVAVQGCCHGELDKIYSSLKYIQETQGRTVDLLIICGDFQAMRNETDLAVKACPPKYRSIGNFWEYYTGRKRAPIPTIFVGGNHEASNFLWELYHGGWVCPNIYFLGYANCVWFGGLRIAGLSGIFKQNHYQMGHHEVEPYSEDHMRSIYHVRDDTLGSPASKFLMDRLRPAYWFAAHLHVKFAAIIRHKQLPSTAVANPDEIVIDDNDNDDDDDDGAHELGCDWKPPTNPDEITIDDIEFEYVNDETGNDQPDQQQQQQQLEPEAQVVSKAEPIQLPSVSLPSQNKNVA